MDTDTREVINTAVPTFFCRVVLVKDLATLTYSFSALSVTLCLKKQIEINFNLFLV